MCEGLLLSLIVSGWWGDGGRREGFWGGKLDNFKCMWKFYWELLRNLWGIWEWDSGFVRDVGVR